MSPQALRQLARAAPRRAAAWAVHAQALDFWPVAAVVLLAGLAGYRAQLVDASYGSFTGCHGCLNASAAASDAMALAFLLVALGVARGGVPRAFRIGMGIAAVGSIVFFAADIVVFRLLTQRLLVTDVLHFSRDGSRLAGVVTPWLGQREGALALAAMLAAAFAAWRALVGPPPSARPAHWIIASVAVLAAAGEWPQAEYLHDVAYLNVWQVNHQVDPSRPYSGDFHRGHGTAPTAWLECDAGLAQRPSVVVAVVESLSAYHSKLFSGLRDDTPDMDALAQEGTYSRTFHANGFSTEGGLIALLTGTVPIPTAGRFGSAMAFTQVRGDFHRWLAHQGYFTAFFTTGELRMSQRGQWLRSIGIAYAEGADHPFYRGMPRAGFDAAPDGALVDRFLAWYDGERRPGPFMATLLTVGTHPPFVMPGVGVVGEDETVREVDRQVARLARQLRERHFFDDGILVVVGDHRAMTPIPREEREALGTAAEVRVMAFWLGRTGLAPGEIHGNFQQTDLIPSLQHVIADRGCRDEWQGRFLGADPVPAEFIVHSDPMRRDEVGVIDGARHYRVRLDGDDTRFVDGPPPAPARIVLDRVNYERMSRMPEFGAVNRSR